MIIVEWITILAWPLTIVIGCIIIKREMNKQEVKDV